MFKLVFLCFTLFISAWANETQNIDNEIKQNKNILKSNKNKNKKTKLKIKNLVNEIISEEKKFNNLEYKLNKVSNNIFLNKLKLMKSKKDIKMLHERTKILKQKVSAVEVDIVDSIVKKYSLSLSQNLINKNTLESIILKEKYNLILENAKDSILKSNLKYFELSNTTRKNELKKSKIEAYILSQEKEKRKYNKLKEKKLLSLQKLQLKHKTYQIKLKSIINKQFEVSNLLKNLNILKNDKIRNAKLAKKRKEAQRKKKKEALAKLRAKTKNLKMKSTSKTKTKSKKVVVKNSKELRFSSKKTLEKDIDLKVRNIGSTSKGIKISRYRGSKTIAPLKRYTITKKFGKFFDDVYKIELFNESISMKSKTKNSKVYSVLKGKVVYAKHDAGELGNVVIIKHKNNLHTIYSQLSNIPKTLKVGQWIKKGYVVGRVENTLVFQATRNNRYLNPEKLFKK